MYKRFYNFNLSDEVLNAVSEMGFEQPTPIQEIAIPPAMEGLDIIGQAQTGTGKTAAFAYLSLRKASEAKLRMRSFLPLHVNLRYRWRRN
jgi:ATP-dependent RNA helicase DeaD